VPWINLATDVADLIDSMTLKWQQNKKSNQFKLCSKRGATKNATSHPLWLKPHKKKK